MYIHMNWNKHKQKSLPYYMIYSYFNYIYCKYGIKSEIHSNLEVISNGT